MEKPQTHQRKPHSQPIVCKVNLPTLLFENSELNFSVMDPIDKKGLLITFEGPEEISKFTYSNYVAVSLIADRFKVKLITPKNRLKNYQKIYPIMEQNFTRDFKLLALTRKAALAQEIEEIVKPSLKEGKTVVMSNFYYHRVLDDHLFGDRIPKFAQELPTAGVVPDLAIVLDLPFYPNLNHEVESARVKKLGSKLSPREFHEDLRHRMLRLKEKQVETNWHVVDASKGIEVLPGVMEIVKTELGNRNIEGSRPNPERRG